MTPVCPVNRMIIQVESQFNEVLKFKSGVQLFITTRFNPEEKVSLFGRVVSLPLSYKRLPGVDGSGFGTARPGDTVMIRYDVLARTREQPEGDASARYRNELNISGEQFWFCYPDQVFAVKRDLDWEMIGDYVMIQPWVEELPKYFVSDIVRPDSWQEDRPPGVGIAMYGEYAGEKVHFRPDMAQHYVLEEEDILIIKKRYICGVEKVPQ